MKTTYSAETRKGTSCGHRHKTPYAAIVCVQKRTLDKKGNVKSKLWGVRDCFGTWVSKPIEMKERERDRRIQRDRDPFFADPNHLASY